ADDPFRCCRRIATAPRPAPHVNVGPAGTGVVAHNRLAPSLPGGAAVRRRGPLWPNGMSGLPSLRDDTTVPMVSPNIGLATAPRQGRHIVIDEFTDVIYEVENGLAWIIINRPDRYNAFRARTIDELVL